jgi:hypothetical protein
MTFKEFLETIHPGKWVDVSDVSKLHPTTFNSFILEHPKLYLYCSIDEGERFFKMISGLNYISADKLNDLFLVYLCCNCGKSFKTFALSVRAGKSEGPCQVFKYGELPAFGSPIPAKTITLIGPDKDLFLTGRRAENQGMGIGAFTYYRRVVENQKNRIFDEIIRVIGKIISPDDPVIQELESAKNEIQFTKAVETIKHTLPQSLLINGQNPLTLLHSALSQGVHEHSDAECLELASNIRIVLIEFAERLGQALKEETELNEAVKRLAEIRAKKEKKNS